MVTIKLVKSCKDKKTFLDFPLKLYKDNPYFVPPLYSDEQKIFKKDYYYNQTSESIFFLAFKDGKCVGRIQGILQNASNEKWKQSRIRFTRFDSINDQEVADALFKHIEDWARVLDIKQIVGPLGYSDFEREGLLIKGFDYLSTFEEQYNFPYYQNLIENYGFRKEIDWLERRLFPPKKEESEKFISLADKILKRTGLHVVEGLNIKQICDKYGDQFFKLVDETYENLYQTVPFLDEQKKEVIKAFKLILSPYYVRIIVDKNDELKAFGLCFPAIGKDLQKSGGHLTLPAIFKVLRTIKNPEGIDLGLVGVAKDMENSGITIGIFAEIMKILCDGKISYCETNLNLETNQDIQRVWEKRFPNIQHKIRRSFIKDV